MLDFQEGKNNAMKKNISHYLLISTLLIILFSSPFRASASVNDVHLSYLYGATSNAYLNAIDATAGSLNTATPLLYELNADGSLKSLIDTSLIQKLHKRGLKVFPFISNHLNRNLGQTSMSNREKLATQLVDSVMKIKLDGIDIDIENLNLTDKDNFTDFIRLLNQKLPSNKILSIAVAANPNGWTACWYGSYDYVTLSKYTDYFMLLAYDESREGSPANPVASYPFVEKSIQYLIHQSIGSKKLC